MRFSDVMHMKQSTLKRFFRLPRFEEHLELHRLDASSAHGDLTLYHFARDRFANMPPEEFRPPLYITGADLIAAGYKPGTDFKQMLSLAEDAQLEGRIHSKEEGMQMLSAQFPLPE